MSCRCVMEQWRRDMERQRRLAKAAAKLREHVQVLYRKPDGAFAFTDEGNEFEGELIEIITQY